jgi:hypothetical protein
MATNGNAVESSKPHKFNPNFTKAVINATGPKATVDEWMHGVELVRLSDRPTQP